MTRMRVLRQVLHDTRADRFWNAFLIQFFLSALVIWLMDPAIGTYREALWYCYAVVTTIGFGDIVVSGLIPRLLSVLLSISAVLVIALVTGVIVNWYNRVTELKNTRTVTAFLDKMEHLPELSREELTHLSEEVKRFRRS